VTENEQEAAQLFMELGAVTADSDPVDAERSYRKSLALAPEVATARAGLAAVLFRLHRYAEAEMHLCAALRIDPDHVEANRLQAEYLVADGRVPEAIQRFVGSMANGAHACVRSAFGDLLARLGLRRDAEAQYRRAATDGSPEAHANLALLLADEGRLDEALLELDRALVLDPDLVEARLNRANVLVELGRDAEAEPVYTLLSGVDDVAGAAWWGLAAVRARRGDERGAREARRRAIVLEPDLARRCPAAREPLPV
jgi:tetratricopeptide (TPR) repeat protein